MQLRMVTSGIATCLALYTYAYCNMPHESTREKPNYLLFGIDFQTPTEAAFLPPSQLQLTNVADYREELTMALSTARNTAAASIQKAQRRYKQQYDKDINPPQVQLGYWYWSTSQQISQDAIAKYHGHGMQYMTHFV